MENATLLQNCNHHTYLVVLLFFKKVKSGRQNKFIAGVPV